MSAPASAEFNYDDLEEYNDLKGIRVGMVQIALDQHKMMRNMSTVDKYKRTPWTHFGTGETDDNFVLDHKTHEPFAGMGSNLATTRKGCAELCDTTPDCVGFQYRNIEGQETCNALFTRHIGPTDNKYVPEWLDKTPMPVDDLRTNKYGGDKINLAASHGFHVYQKEWSNQNQINGNDMRHLVHDIGVVE